MKLPQFCIERPVFATVLSLILIVLGVMGLSRISIRGYPDISSPVVMISTGYNGASADVIESQITTPIENELAGVNNLDSMRSMSVAGRSRVILLFDLGANIESAVNDIRDHLARIQSELPKEASAPIVQRRDPDDTPILFLSITAPKMDQLAITDYATRYLLPQLQQVDGVSNVDLDSAGSYALRVWLNPSKMAEHKVVVSDIANTLNQKNIDVPSGQIQDAARSYNVLVSNMKKSASDFSKLILRDDNGYLLPLSDVAQVKMGSSTANQMAYENNQSMVSLEIYAQGTANPIAVVEALQKTLNHMKMNLPAGMQLHVLWDSTQFLKISLHNVYVDLLFALLLVVLVVWGFLGSWRSAFVPVITIPICLISVFAFMYFVGFSLNIFTSLALVLAIGLVVDDAIVMLENIYRHIEEGMPVLQAALQGSREIAFAVIAMTITLAAVYAPIGFAQGMTGIVFREFAYTLAMAVVISGFVALTLSPMMSSKFLKPVIHKGKYNLFLDHFFQHITIGYQKILHWALDHRRWVVMALCIFSALGYGLYHFLPSELSPKDDLGVLQVDIEAPPNASMDLMKKYALQVNSVIQTLPELDNYSQYVNPSNISGYIVLKPWDQRSRSANDIARNLIPALKNIPGIDPMVHSMSLLGGGGKNGGSLQMVLTTGADFTRLKSVANEFMAALEKNPNFSQVQDDLILNNQQYEIHINDNLAETLGVATGDINQTMQVMLGGLQATNFVWNNYSYPVILQLPDQDLQNLEVINRLYLRSSKDEMIPVSTVAKVKSVFGPTELDHYNRLRADTITVQLNKDYSMGQAIQAVRQLMKQQLPDDMTVQFKGTAKTFLKSGNTVALSFGLALLFIYMVLAAQFESFIDPFIILLTVPLAVVGALFTLFLADQTLSIYTNIGLVTLIGLIAKHGILITEFTNQLRQQGMALREALITAASLRLRPILMTTMAMVVGALPLAFAHGAGKIGRQEIGWVIVGGMLIGTVFSLLIVPVAYSFLGRFRKYNEGNSKQSD